MSKQRGATTYLKHGNSGHSQLAMHEIERKKKHHMLAEMIKRKEEANKAPLDDWFKNQTHQTAKALVAQYLVRKKRSIKQKTILKSYGISYSLWYRYKRYNDGKVLKCESINSYIMDNWNDLNKSIDKSPSPTIEEVKRLFSLANDEVKRIPRNEPKEVQLKTEDDHTEDYDHMLSKEQKVELMDLANLELSEVKPITKSDVVVGVIVGAVVGASMAAYLFITNGAI